MTPLRIVKDYGLMILLGFLIVLFGLLSPVFVSIQNLLNILDQISIIGIIALGMTLVILTGGIDLSVGSIVAFTGIILAMSLVAGFSFPVSIIFCVLAGVSFGCINGFFVAYGRIPAFIVTLGLMSIARGASLYIADGRTISNLPDGFSDLANAGLIGLPVSAVIFLLLTVLFWVFMTFTYWGKFIYAIGGNERAAWLSGISTKKYKMLVYLLTGFVCAISSILLVSKLNAAPSQAGNLYELNAIAAVIIGGASLSGGKGSILGTFLGVLVLGVLQNGFSVLNVSPYYQQILLGIIVILAVYVDKKSFEDE